MAFGGTAKTYASWQLIGEPFEESGRSYILVQKPGATTQKKVRWYADKAHADLMPNQSEGKSLYSIFGFENENDYILAIRTRDISNEERKAYFRKENYHDIVWVISALFGEILYANKSAVIPPIANADKVFRIYWKDWNSALKKYQASLA